MTIDIITEFEEIEQAIKLVKEKGWIKGIRDVIEKVVLFVEKLNDEFSGHDKKKIALELVEQVYNYSKIDIPVLPHKLELAIIKFVAGLLIDKIVKEFNEKGIFTHE